MVLTKRRRRVDERFVSVGLLVFVFMPPVTSAQEATTASPRRGGAVPATGITSDEEPTPGDSGGATVALPGQTLAAGQFQSLLVVTDIEYHSVSDAGIIEASRRIGSFNSIDREITPTLEIDYGVTDRFQIGVQGGYFVSQGYRDAEYYGNGRGEFGSGSFAGPSDTWLLAKYEVLAENRLGFLSPFVGLKLPTGREDVRLSDGLLVKATDQPGTGAVDFELGLAYSRFLSDRVTTDISGVYVFHTEHDYGKVGDSLTLAVDVAYRLSESTKTVPRFGIFAQAFATILDKDTLYDASDPNSGGTTLFLSPGLFAQLSDAVSLTIGPAFPVYQQLNGDQVKAQVEYLMSIAITF